MLALTIVGCSEQMPIMTVDQQKTYNDCMTGRWSGAADTFWWGPFGWAYYDSVSKDCLAKAGSLGLPSTAQASVTPATAVGSDQPVSASTEEGIAPVAKPAPGGASSH
jgi:hypothetical protein